jgi:hypothetical protein
LTSIDENLKSLPRQFWKHVGFFRKINSASLQLEEESKHLIGPCDIPDEFAKHLIQHTPILVLLPSPTFCHLNFYL